MASNTDAEAGKSGLLASKTQQKDEPRFQAEGIRNDDSKLFRMFVVAMYVCLVSGLGFLFALYHLFFWDSTMPPVPIVHGHEAY